MVRNRRSTVGLQFTRRWARTERLAPDPGRTTAARSGRRVRPTAPSQTGQGLPLAHGPAVAADGAGQLQPGRGPGSWPTWPRRRRWKSATARPFGNWPRRPAGRRRVPRWIVCSGCWRVPRQAGAVHPVPRHAGTCCRQRLTQAGHTVAVFHGGLTRPGQGGRHQCVPRPLPHPARHRIGQ